MFSIIIDYSDGTKEAALAAGYREKTVLIKQDPVQSTEENKTALTRECMRLKPYRFIVSDAWGAGPG